MPFPSSDLNGQSGILNDFDVIEIEEGFNGDTYWRTQDGKYVRIKDMSDSHLLNTLRVLRAMSPIGTQFKTTSERRRRWVNAIANEVYKRGLQIDPLVEGELVHE